MDPCALLKMESWSLPLEQKESQRSKKQQGFTNEIINYALDSCGMTLDNIDCVATNDFRQELFGNDYIVDFVIQGKELKCYIIPHHLAHCASSFYTSPFHEAHCFSMVVVWGKLKQTLWWHMGEKESQSNVYVQERWSGVLYGEVTEKLGLGPALHKAGTTMGLSSYGTPFDFDYQSYTDDIKHKMDVGGICSEFV